MYSPWTILIVLAVVLLIVWLVVRSRRKETYYQHPPIYEKYTPSIYDKVHAMND
jgi:hypothetical protein